MAREALTAAGIPIQSGATSIDVPFKREKRFNSICDCPCEDRELCSVPSASDGGLCGDTCAPTPGTKNPNRAILTIPSSVIRTILMSFATIPLDARAVATLRLFPLATSRLVALLSASVFDANVIEAQRLHVESMDGGWERLGGRVADGERLEKVY